MKKKVILEKNKIYINRNGCEYVCKDVYADNKALMERIKDGWTLVAHGVYEYEDGLIEWGYSTNGKWVR